MPCLLGSYAYQSSQPKHAVFSRISDFLLDIRSHYRRIVLGYIRIHKPLLSFLCHFTCFCIVFCFHCDCAVGVVCSGSWSVAFLWSELVFPVCFFLVLSRHDHILPPINTCSFFCRCLLYHLAPLHCAKGFAVKPPNIYFSHSPSSFHCKFTQLPVASFIRSMLLDTIFEHRFQRIRVAITRVPSDKGFLQNCNDYLE